MIIDIVFFMYMLVTLPAINIYKGIRHSMTVAFVISYIFCVHLLHKIHSNKPYKYG